MQPTHTQPHANPISDDLVAAILANAVDGDEVGPVEVNRHGEFSNDVAVVTVPGGRRLMVKRGRHPWSGERFEVARRAAVLLRRGAGIVAPEPLKLPPDLEAAPVEAYWRIELPLFADAWGGLDGPQRRGAMRSLGALIRQAHAAERAADDSLPRPSEPFSVGGLEQDIRERLRPAIAGEWPDAVDMVDRLLETLPEVFRGTEVEPVVLHGDLHLGNVLCRWEGDRLHCVGLLDLEWVHYGPPESDLARFLVMHGGPFQMPVERSDLDLAFEGYGRPLDEGLLAFFMLLHLLNLGLYSAMIGDGWHAGEVEAEARKVRLGT